MEELSPDDNDDSDFADADENGVRSIYQRRIYLQVNPLLVYHPGFDHHHHHHIGDYGLIVEDYDCYGSV